MVPDKARLGQPGHCVGLMVEGLPVWSEAPVQQVGLTLLDSSDAEHALQYLRLGGLLKHMCCMERLAGRGSAPQKLRPTVQNCALDSI